MKGQWPTRPSPVVTNHGFWSWLMVFIRCDCEPWSSIMGFQWQGLIRWLLLAIRNIRTCMNDSASVIKDQVTHMLKVSQSIQGINKNSQSRRTESKEKTWGSREEMMKSERWQIMDAVHVWTAACRIQQEHPTRPVPKQHHNRPHLRWNTVNTPPPPPPPPPHRKGVCLVFPLVNPCCWCMGTPSYEKPKKLLKIICGWILSRCNHQPSISRQRWSMILVTWFIVVINSSCVRLGISNIEDFQKNLVQNLGIKVFLATVCLWGTKMPCGRCWFSDN